ncbi:hypothetical protein GUJ93_ZPchr0004g39706 [Zizania palustris]|uniref:Uncharacterized protein n=1 Tax=Zizania palustris TaxID=103762 RepID=A0A8J5VZG3_ZIZPA|nr:hypothetical protein GUJ93_ZPchr0004g39706 [Zizania palustris]
MERKKSLSTPRSISLMWAGSISRTFAPPLLPPAWFRRCPFSRSASPLPASHSVLPSSLSASRLVLSLPFLPLGADPAHLPLGIDVSSHAPDHLGIGSR